MIRSCNRRVPAPLRLRLARSYLLVTLCGLGIVSGIFASPARAVENDPLLWLTAIGSHPVAENLRASLFLQARFFDDMSEFERFVVNPSLGWSLGRGVSVAGGYDAHVIRNPRVRLEHRTWQQLAARHALGPLEVFHRFRLEQRYIEGEDGAANRLRWWLEGGVPIASTRWRVLARNEAFFDLDAKRQGPTQAGFGETRLFVGFDGELRDGLSAEIGYQLQYVDRRRREDLAAHTLLATIFFSAD